MALRVYSVPTPVLKKTNPFSGFTRLACYSTFLLAFSLPSNDKVATIECQDLIVQLN